MRQIIRHQNDFPKKYFPTIRASTERAMHDTNGDLLQNATQDPGSEPSQASGDGFRGCNKLTWITYAKFLQQMNGACRFESSVRPSGDRAAIRLPDYQPTC